MTNFSSRPRSAALAALLAGLSATIAAAASMPQLTTIYDGAFARVPAVRDSGRSVAEHCQIGAQTSVDNWSDAKAHLTLNQRQRYSELTISVENARPNTLYTVWLMLADGSPVMDAKATALVHSDDLAEAIQTVGDAKTPATNGFVTDAEGNGGMTLTLDYAVAGGEFPFQRLTDIDLWSDVFTAETPRAIPARIADAGDGAPFTLRLASHCGDNLHNGLVAGQHEPWFDWLAE